MTTDSGKNKAALVSLLLLALIFLAGPAWARPEKFDVKVGGHRIQVESDDVRLGDVFVAKGDTYRGDLVARGGSVTVDGVVEGDCVAFGGPIMLNGQVRQDVAAFGGPVTVAGEAKGDLASFGGPVTISGSVEGDIASFGGLVKLLPTAIVDGDIAVMGGQVEKSDSAVVHGQIKSLSLGMFNHFLPGAVSLAQKKTPVSRWLSFFISLTWTAAAALLVLLTVLFFPKNVERLARAAEEDIWRCIGIGLLAQIALAPGLFLLVISILGIALIPLAILVFLAAIVIGFAGFCLLTVSRLFSAWSRPVPQTAAATLLGFLILYSLLLVGHLINVPGAPFNIIGWILIIADLSLLWFAATVGLGAVWITRFGSRPAGSIPAPVVHA